MQIKATVGADGVNSRADALVVQQLLNTAGAELLVDGDVGLRTVTAIKRYQRNFLSAPDGRVDPGGLTMRNLASGQLRLRPDRAPEPRTGPTLAVLPRGSATRCGYYTYSGMTGQYGTAECIQALLDVALRWGLNVPEAPFGIGDISLQQGGPMPHHASHRHGTHVDIRPLRKDSRRVPVTIQDPQYSHDQTQLLIDALRAHHNVKAILFNDPKAKGVTAWKGHDNHLHVTMRS